MSMFDGVRPIPGFPGYVMGKDGQVYNGETGRKLTVFGSGNRRWGYYTLYKHGRRHNRSERELYRITYGDPEVSHRDEEGEWRKLQEFPDYEMSDFGFIRTRDTKRRVNPQEDRYGTTFVRLSKNGKRYRRTEEHLMLVTFPETREWNM